MVLFAQLTAGRGMAYTSANRKTRDKGYALFRTFAQDARNGAKDYAADFTG